MGEGLRESCWCWRPSFPITALAEKMFTDPGKGVLDTTLRPHPEGFVGTLLLS